MNSQHSEDLVNLVIKRLASGTTIDEIVSEMNSYTIDVQAAICAAFERLQLRAQTEDVVRALHMEMRRRILVRGLQDGRTSGLSVALSCLKDMARLEGLYDSTRERENSDNSFSDVPLAEDLDCPVM